MNTWKAHYKNKFTFQFLSKDMMTAMITAESYGKKLKLGEPLEVFNMGKIDYLKKNKK